MQSSLGCQLLNFRFFQFTERKPRTGQLLLVQSGKKVGLIFQGIKAFMQVMVTLSISFDSGVVPRRQLMRPEFACPLR